MDNRPQQKNRGANQWAARLDRTAGELNVVLLVLAIGLGILDVTCFLAFKARDALPSPARIEVDAAVASKPIATLGQTLTAVAPTKPAAPMTGW